MKKLIAIFCILCFSNLSAQQSKPLSDLRDSFIGLYEGNNLPAPENFYILVEKNLSVPDSIIITDSLWSTAPSPGCPASCNQHKAILNPDSTWFQSGMYNGHFKNQDSIHLFFFFPGPTYYYYDGKKVTNVTSVTNLNGSKDNLYVFPNPASNELRVLMHNNTTPLKISMYDISGKLWLQDTFIKAGLWNVSEFPPGVYAVKIEGTDIKIFKRIVIVR